MKKKAYNKLAMQVVTFQVEQHLLAGSDGNSNMGLYQNQVNNGW